MSEHTMDIERFRIILTDYTADLSLPPLNNALWRCEFDRVSYYQFAVDELYRYVVKKFSPFTSGTVYDFCRIIKEFADKIHRYAEISQKNTHRIFLVMEHAVWDILIQMEDCI